jgi:hypothetical protein
MSSLMGVCYSGSYQGKVLWIHHAHDSSVWPAWGTLYHRAVRQAQGEAGARENFRIRWTEFAEHGPHEMVPAEPHRAAATRLIDFRGITEQSMIDLIDWAENGVEPSGTSYSFTDGQVRLPAAAAERGGIQPVASATANGTSRAEVAAGAPVTLSVTAAVPPGAGTIISVELGLRRQRNLPVPARGARRRRGRADRLDHACLRPPGHLLRHGACHLPPHRRRAGRALPDRDDRPGPGRRHGRRLSQHRESHPAPFQRIKGVIPI